MISRKHFVLFGVLIFVLMLLISCGNPEPETKVGKIVGVRASFSLNDMADGVIKDMNFWGVIIVQLEDGTRVDAAVDKELAENLRGGDKVVIQETEDPEMWKVLRLAGEDDK